MEQERRARADAAAMAARREGQELQEQASAELCRRDAEQSRLEREIQRIVSESEELRELDRSLRVAYINKERAAQHQEAALLQTLEQQREQQMDALMEDDRRRREAEERAVQTERRDRLVAQKLVLQRQMEENDVMRSQAREEALRDKAVVDEVIAKIDEEERLERMARQKKTEETRAMVRGFQQERERQGLAMEEQEREEREKIEAYNELMKERHRQEEEERQRIEAEKQRRW